MFCIQLKIRQGKQEKVTHNQEKKVNTSKLQMLQTFKFSQTHTVCVCVCGWVREREREGGGEKITLYMKNIS